MRRISLLLVIALLGIMCAKMPDKFVILPPIDGLVAYYPFNGNAKDESGNKYDGIVHGATLTEDRFGNQKQAYKFDGIDDYIDCGDILNDLNVPFTISAWINIQAYDKTKHMNIFKSDMIDQIDPLPNYYGIMFQVSNVIMNGEVNLDEPRLRISYGDGTGNGRQMRRTKDSNANLLINQWVHVASVARGQEDMDLYINGESASGPYSGTGGNMAHNNWHAFIGYLYYGSIDELYIFNKALSNAEILQLYNSTK